MNDFFDDDNPNKEFDPDEHLAELGYGGEGVRMPGSPPPPIQTKTISEEVMEEEYESLAHEYTEEQADLLSQADSRLEKANLYRMLLNHDLFGEVDCSAIIVNEVQEELKNIILDKLEVLLGIKAEEQKQDIQLAVDLPFNALQIEALIQWADKLTKGKSQGAAPAQAIVSRESTIKPMGGARKAPAIKKLSGSSLNQRREIPKQKVPEPEKIERNSRPTVNVKAEEFREEWIDPKKMTEDERLKHNLKNQNKYKSTPATSASMPMPDFNQTQLHYQQSILTQSSQPSPLLQNLQKAIEATQRETTLSKMNGGS